MRINIFNTTDEMGRDAARFIAAKLNAAIEARGEACIVLSTGASQFAMFEHLTDEQLKVDWTKVTMFHLDEYVALPGTHIASFRRYLKERFASRVPLKEAVYVSGEGDVQEQIASLTERIRAKQIDVGVIGIGENGHIAFNDPPADFETQESYIVVNLDDRCKQQQVGEGWFATADEVPDQAISMTVSQIMKADCIVSIAPYAVKQDAIARTLTSEVTNRVPATILKTHPDWNLWLDAASAAGWMRME